MKIGICDWGIGGVGIYKLLREKTSADVIYFSDTGFTPYGKVPENELKQRLHVVFEYLQGLGCEKIIVGCNAASTVLEDTEYITGVIDHGVNVVVAAEVKEVAIVGGKRTIDSGIYKTKLESKGIQVHQQIAQPLSGRIEAGDLNSDEMHRDIREIFEPIKNIDHILLACTHYPLIKQQILHFTKITRFLDPAEQMVEWINLNWKLTTGANSVRWLTSGDASQMQNSLRLLYNMYPSFPQNISL